MSYACPECEAEIDCRCQDPGAAAPCGACETHLCSSPCPRCGEQLRPASQCPCGDETKPHRAWDATKESLSEWRARHRQRMSAALDAAKLKERLVKKLAAEGMMMVHCEAKSPDEVEAARDRQLVEKIGALSRHTRHPRWEVEAAVWQVISFEGSGQRLQSLMVPGGPPTTHGARVVAHVMTCSEAINNGVATRPDAIAALMESTRPDPEFDRALAQIVFRVAERELKWRKGCHTQAELTEWREAATTEECVRFGSMTDDRLDSLVRQAMERHRQRDVAAIPTNRIEGALAQVESRVAERMAMILKQQTSPWDAHRWRDWRMTAIDEECVAALPDADDADDRSTLFHRAVDRYRLSETSKMTDPDIFEKKARLEQELGSTTRKLVEANQLYGIEKRTRIRAQQDNKAWSLRLQGADQMIMELRQRKDSIATERDAMQAHQGRTSIEIMRLHRKNEALAQQIESTGTKMEEQYPQEQDKVFDVEAARAAVARADAAMAAATPMAAQRPVSEMLTDAVKLATVQQTSKLAVQKVSPLLIQGGLPRALVMDVRFQGILGLVLPYLVSRYGYMVPGLKQMHSVQAMSQQQLIIGAAEIIGVSLMDLIEVGLEIMKSLNAGTPESVEQLDGE